jgi:Zn finger protein HypA/HybF involved in hydrogenase expression
MALIPCHECGAKISDTAMKCPQCGAGNKKVGTATTVYLVVILIAFILWMVQAALS